MSAIHCRHYSGRDMLVDDAPCKAGIYPVTAFCGGDTFGWVKRVPCLKSNVGVPECSSCSYPTPEEIKAEDEAHERHFADFMKWMPLARNRITEVADQIEADSPPLHTANPARVDSGALDCPKCGGVNTLSWSRARCNGHVHAKCSTEDCLGWIE